jgi:hypothetical protein
MQFCKKKPIRNAKAVGDEGPSPCSHTATYLKYKQQLAIASRVWAYMFKQTQRKMRYTIYLVNLHYSYICIQRETIFTASQKQNVNGPTLIDT